MKKIEQWLRITPVDTLFFKGSEPMIAGQNHEAASVFPPMPETVMGAIRNAMLGQRRIPLKDFLNGDQDKYAEHSCLGTPAQPGFEITGPIFEVMESTRDVFVPAPAHWFAESLKRLGTGDRVQVSPAQVCASQFKTLGLKGSVSQPLWVHRPRQEDLKSLSGAWINLRALETVTEGGGELCFARRDPDNFYAHDPHVPTLAVAGFFHASEIRTGIALEPNRSRRVKKGYLYTFTQVRMHPRTSLLIGLSQGIAPKSLDSEGLLQLGGEQRIVKYEVVTDIDLPRKNSEWIFSLGPVRAESIQGQASGLADFPRASGPMIRTSGWDMKNNFHKPVSSFFPPGTAIHIGPDTVNTFFGFMST